MIQPLGEPTIAVPELPARGSCCVCPKRPSSPSVKPAEDGNGVTSCGCTTPPTDVPADSPQASPVSPPLQSCDLFGNPTADLPVQNGATRVNVPARRVAVVRLGVAV
ncbi:MAG: hypothetical protein R2873_14130 [Caldilineaceae bacterium]